MIIYVMDEKDSVLIQFVVRKNKLPSSEPKRFPSGQINRVYDLGGCVLKIEGSDLTDYAKGVIAPQARIIQTLTALGAKVPAVIDHGEFAGRPYLLMRKAEGTNLVYDWLKFSLAEKEHFIAQLCEQLKIFHSVKFDDYVLPIYLDHKFANLKTAVANVTNFALIDKSRLKPEYLVDVEYLEDFFARQQSVLDEGGTAVLVHSDIHLENLFYQGDKLTAIIDFDWISAAPRDYELWKITDVFYDPKKTAAQGLQSLYQGYRMTEEFKFIRKYYPELFQSSDVLTRVRLFHLENLIYKVTDYQKGRWSEAVLRQMHQQIDDFFRGSWLAELFT